MFIHNTHDERTTRPILSQDRLEDSASTHDIHIGNALSEHQVSQLRTSHVEAEHENLLHGIGAMLAETIGCTLTSSDSSHLACEVFLMQFHDGRPNSGRIRTITLHHLVTAGRHAIARNGDMMTIDDTDTTTAGSDKLFSGHNMTPIGGWVAHVVIIHPIGRESRKNLFILFRA